MSNGDSNTKEFSNTIDVDEQGRIKVLFHFEENKTTSGYLRLSNIPLRKGESIVTMTDSLYFVPSIYNNNTAYV